MEHVIEKLGLPVKCHICKTRGNIKPRTDYGGWSRWKPLRGAYIWYCPDHPGAGERRSNPVLGSTASEPNQGDELDELMDMI